MAGAEEEDVQGNEKKCLRNLEQWTWMETDYGKITDLQYLHGVFSSGP